MSVQCHCGSWDHEPRHHPTTDDTRPLSAAGSRLLMGLRIVFGANSEQCEATAQDIRDIEDEAREAERARHAALVAAAREYSDRSAPIHDPRCAAQDDDEPCFCGSSATYQRLLDALRAALDGEPHGG